MKKFLLVLVILNVLILNAGTPEGDQNSIFDHLTTDAKILTDNGILKDAVDIKTFTSNFEKSSYTKVFAIEVNGNLEYEIGGIVNNSGTYTVMFLKTKAAQDAYAIEFLTIYKNTPSELDAMAIDASRNLWMSLCNAHAADKLVEKLYTSQAYYYNRGRLLQGTKALTTEYSYMNMSSYALKLTPKHVVSVTPEIVYEIGQCSGSYPLPYMLVWQKQEDGTWQILMDSNY